MTSTNAINSESICESRSPAKKHASPPLALACQTNHLPIQWKHVLIHLWKLGWASEQEIDLWKRIPQHPLQIVQALLHASFTTWPNTASQNAVPPVIPIASCFLPFFFVKKNLWHLRLVFGNSSAKSLKSSKVKQCPKANSCEDFQRSNRTRMVGCFHVIYTIGSVGRLYIYLHDLVEFIAKTREKYVPNGE